VRVGIPQYVKGLQDVVRNPVYATGVGLLLFGNQHNPVSERSPLVGGGFKSVWAKMKSWFQGNF
jgi:cell division protein FtsA